MKKAKVAKVETIEEKIASGELVFLDEYTTRKEGLGVRVAMPKVDFDALDMVKKTAAQYRAKSITPLVNAIMWLVVRCQKTGIKANAVVALEAAGFPPLVMTVHPFNVGSKESVLLVQRKKEVQGYA